jgi:hypothetical protein
MSESESKRRRRAASHVERTPIQDRTRPRENQPVDEKRLAQAKSAMAEVSGH